MTPAPGLLPGLATVAGRYRGFVVDLWGCVHNGEAAYPGVADCLARLRACGTVCLLSNAPRRTGGVVRRLAEFGLDARHFDCVLTSGEAARAALADPPDAWHAALGTRCWHLGPDRDKDVLRDHPRVREVAEPEAADFVLNTGPVSFDDPEDHYDPVLARCAARGLPMLCANPDLVVVVGERLVLCAGTLARRYEAMGGVVRQHGKPYPAIYGRCLELMGNPAPAEVLAIGDGMHTDVLGGARAGLDTAFIPGGIHREDLGLAWGEMPAAAVDLAPLIATHGGAAPTWVVPSLRW